MNKIPVGGTILFVYRFLFTQIGTVVSIAGLPALAFAGADYASRAFIAADQANQAPDADPSGSAGLAVLASLFVALVASSVTAVALTRVVFAQLGGANRLPFLETVIRMVGANLRLALGAFILLILASGINYLASRLAGVPAGGGSLELTPALLFAALASWAAFLYAFTSILRMGFLLSAVVVTEAKGGLKRSHDLAEGNTWRAFAVVFVLGLPIAALLITAASLILRSALGPDFPVSAVTSELIRRAQNAIAERLLPWELFNAVIFVLYSGLAYSGAAFAYRAVVEHPDWRNAK